MHISYRKNSISKKVGFWVHLKIDIIKKKYRFWRQFFLAFLTKLMDPPNFTFAYKNGRKRRKEWVSGKNKNAKRSLECCQRPICDKFFKKAFKKIIGVQAERALFVTNVYWATFKKSLENEKWPSWQMIRMEFFFKNRHFWKKKLIYPVKHRLPC